MFDIPVIVRPPLPEIKPVTANVFDKDKFIEKYTRRINRFRDIVKNKEIFKIFVIASDKKLNITNE